MQKSLLVLLFVCFVGQARGQTGRPTKKEDPPTKNDATRSASAPEKVAASSEVEAEGNAQRERAKERLESDQLDKRTEWFYRQRSSVNGRIPAGARWNGYQHVQKMMAAEGKLARRADGTYAAAAPEAGTGTGTAWASIGPTPTSTASFGAVTGRITTIAVDPSDTTGNTVLVGGAQGGIWRSTNAGATWTAVGDQNPSLAMGSLAFAPSQPALVYAGTGEQAAIGFDIYYGAGVLKSTDHGQTWAPTCTTAGPTCPFIGPYDNITPFGYFTLGGTRISYVAVNPNNPNMILVGAQTQFAEGTTEGVYCSDNGGQTWSNVLAGEMSTFVGFATSTIAYAALGNPFGSSTGAPNGNGIYKAISIGSLCATVHFSRVTGTALPAVTSMGRIDLGIAGNDATGNTVYASIADPMSGSATSIGVFLTTDGGNSWTNLNAPDVCGPQCWYDDVIKVDPTNKNVVYLGGAAAISGSNPGWVVRSVNGGGTWSPAVPTTPGPGLPHVDTHALAFVKLPSGKVRLYLGNDGGIWRTDDAEAVTVTWTNLNDSTLTLSQFYPAISIHPSSAMTAIGGTQDNGTQDYAGNANWTDINVCGDGTGTAIDFQIPSTVYIACNGLNLLTSYQNGATASFSTTMTGINVTDNSNFVPPLVTDPNTANTVYVATSKIYQSMDAGNTWTAITGDLVSGSPEAYLTAVAVAPGNSAVIYTGAQNGALFVATNVTAGSGTFNQVGQSILPGRTVTAIAIDPSASAGTTAYAGFSGFSFVSTALNVNDPVGQVFKTTDGGATWTDISCSQTNCMTRGATDLPNVPVNDVVADADVPGTIYAATDLGVLVRSCTGTSCAWSTLGTGLPRAAVLSLKLHEASRTLRAATHGRGVWDIALSNFAFSGPHISALSPTSANAGGSTALTLTVTGSGLTAGAIEFGSTALAGTGTSSDTSLSGTVPTSLLTSGSTAIMVKTGAGTSNSLPFVVLGGAPTLTSASPSSTPLQVTPGSAVAITLTGTNFVSGSKVLWNGASPGITTKLNSASSLAATLPTALLGPYGSTDDISVVNPPPGGGQSQAIAFKVAAPAPVNDNFANAINITSTSFTDDKDSSGATTEASDPLPPCVNQYTALQGNTGGRPNGVYNTIWYKFTPTFAANLELDTIGSSYDTTLSIWTGAPGSFLNVACNDDITSGVVVQSQIPSVALTAGTTYYVMVGSFGPPDPNPVALGGHAHLNLSYNGGLNPTPTLTSITPASANSGDPGVSLTIVGTNFVSGAVLDFDDPLAFTGSALPTTFVSPTQLTATIPASSITLPGNFQVMVVNPAPNYPFSNTLNFTVNPGTYPVPTLTYLSQTSVIAGSFPIQLFATGTNIAADAVLNFNGVAKTSTRGNSTSIWANLSAADIATAGIVQVSITNPPPGGGTSASLPFTIVQPSIVPTITSVNPTTFTSGSSTNITVTGTNFQSGASVFFAGTYWGTTFVGPTQLTVNPGFAQIPAGTYLVYVIDPAPTGGTSPQPVNITVTAPIPPGFSVTAAPVTLSSATGAAQGSAITVTPSGGFTGTLTLNCPASLPPGVTCIPPPPINITGAGAASANVLLAVMPTSANLTALGGSTERSVCAAGLLPSRGEKSWWVVSGGLGLAAVLLLLWPRRKQYRAVLGLSVLCVLSFTLGCGGGGGGYGGGGGGGPVATVTKLTVVSAKVASGTTIAFTVSVTGGTPTGQVQVLEGGASIASGSVVSGSASLSVSTLAVGTHTISARYLGDVNTLASSSGALNITVTGATTVPITTTPAATPPASPINVTIN